MAIGSRRGSRASHAWQPDPLWQLAYNRVNEPHLGRYLRLLYQDGATTSMFWTWVVTLAASQALFNRRLAWGWRLVLLGVVAMTFYVAYGLNRDWKSGWMPALLVGAAGPVPLLAH